MWDANAYLFLSLTAMASICSVLGLWICIEYLLDEIRSWTEQSVIDTPYGLGNERVRRLALLKALPNCQSLEATSLRP